MTQDSVGNVGYVPPTTTQSNQPDYEAVLARAIAQLRAEAQANGGQLLAPVDSRTPEEMAAEKLSRRGVGLGVNEQLAEVYELLALLAGKVGVL